LYEFVRIRATGGDLAARPGMTKQIVSFVLLAALGAGGCAALFKGDGIADNDKSWHGALSGAVTISNPTGKHPGGGEHVAAKLVDWQINDNFADVSIERVSSDEACFKVSAWQTQAENTKSYDLMIVGRNEQRTISQFPPTATNGQVEVHRRWTKPIYNQFNVEIDQLPYVDYSVCFASGIPLGPDAGSIILRGTNTWNGHAFAIFDISQMGG
jgi:hypothetical protein